MTLNIVEKGKNPHLAVTHEMQGFSANNRPVSLLMKSNIKLTDEILKSIEALGLSDVEEIKKATWYRKKSDGLQKGLTESFCEDEDWCWIEDFNETEVLFWVGCELYRATYTEDSSGMFTFSNEATPMVEVVSYEVADGELKISEAAEKALEEGTMMIVSKAFSDSEKATQIAKSYFEKTKTPEKTNETTQVEKSNDDNSVDVSDIQKNNDNSKENQMSQEQTVDFTKSAEFIEMQKALSDMQAELQKARDEKEAVQKAKDESDKADMLAVLKSYSFVGDSAEGLCDVLFKSAGALKVLEVLEKAHNAVAAIATVEKGADAPDQVTKGAVADEQDAVMALIKAKKAAKK